MEGPKSCQHHYNHHIRNHCGFVEAKSVEQMQKNNQKNIWITVLYGQPANGRAYL